MASHQELSFEWSMLHPNHQNWTLEDLQLAAELGRTLLDRNEELENELKAQQAVIDDQRQEIEFQMKQLTSMKEESLNRSKFYDQLETSVIELERSNTQLSRKHEVDKKRMQSMCENIDYLERKCEELSGALESIRDTNKKCYNGGNGATNKLNRSSYFLHFNGGSSDSSEDDSGYFRTHSNTRRTQSLQDLRDFSSSPDELLDSSPSSNSPDLKLSENEFIQSLESRIEELLAAKKHESEKLGSLESQLKLLVQENANLHEQLAYVAKEKDEQIKDLQIQLMEQMSVPSPLSLPASVSNRLNTSAFSSPGLNFAIGSATSPKFYSPSATTPVTTKSQRNSLNYRNQLQLQQLQAPTTTTAVCKRCSEEINILSLVNSIEDDQLMVADGGGEGRFGDDDDFSSLEFELARASGDHRDQHDGYFHENHHQSNILRLPNLRKSGSGSSSVPNKRLSFDLHEGSNTLGALGGLSHFLNHPNLTNHYNQSMGFNVLADAMTNDDFHSLLPTPLDVEFNEGDSDSDEDGGDSSPEHGAKKEETRTGTPEKSAMSFYEVDPTSLTLKRLELPEKIPAFDSSSQNHNHSHKEQSPSSVLNNPTDYPTGNGLDDFKTVLDTSYKSQEVMKRSKLWWGAWLILLVLGVLELVWRFFFFALCILGRVILPLRLSASPSTPGQLSLSSPSSLRSPKSQSSEKYKYKSIPLPLLSPPLSSRSRSSSSSRASVLF